MSIERSTLESAKKVKEILKKQGRIQQWLAEKVGIDKIVMSRILTGKQQLPLPLAKKIAEVLGVSIEEIA
jgi:DNA-binding XRE family transcriptional regulator